MKLLILAITTVAFILFIGFAKRKDKVAIYWGLIVIYWILNLIKHIKGR